MLRTESYILNHLDGDMYEMELFETSLVKSVLFGADSDEEAKKEAREIWRDCQKYILGMKNENRN